jgi:F0F1-type ATP synthase assembly protein I
VKKTAAKKTTEIDNIEKTLMATTAKRQFLASTTNMGWRLAVTVVIPIVAGVKLDERYGSSPSFTLGGLMIAAIVGSSVVWKTVKEVNQEQAEEEMKSSKRGKRA